MNRRTVYLLADCISLAGEKMALARQDHRLRENECLKSNSSQFKKQALKSTSNKLKYRLEIVDV
jgi:hypothetical protein